MTLVIKNFTTHLSWKPKLNRKPRFFLQNLPKPTDRKHFETVTTLIIWRLHKNTRSIYSAAKTSSSYNFTCCNLLFRMTEFKSKCCQITTIFCKSKIRRIFRLIRIWIQLSFWNAQVQHSSQSAIIHTNANQYTRNCYLLILTSIHIKHRLGQ